MDWNALARPWIDNEVAIETAHKPVKDGLVARAALSAGEHVLDIGCGSGALSLDAAALVGVSGHVMAFDLAEAFVARVEERTRDVAQIATERGDAQRHDFTGAGRDAVISLFGMMFFDDPAAAFANIATSLKPGGRIVFATWAGPPYNPWFTVPGKALAAHLPDLPPPDATAPGPMAFADTGRVRGFLETAGFEGIAAEEVDVHLTPMGAAADTTAMMLAIGPARGAVAQFAPEGSEAEIMDAVTEAITEGYAAFGTEDGLRVPARVIYYSAHRPA